MSNSTCDEVYQPWNLAEANIAIDEFFAFLEYTIPQHEREFLRKIQHIIECTEASNGVIGTLTKETQSELFQEAQEKCKKRAKITYRNAYHIIRLLEQRLQAIRDRKNKYFISHGEEYFLFLEELKKCAQVVFDAIREKYFSEDSSASLLEKFYSAQNPIYNRALLLGGFFKPMSQSYDPLIGKGSLGQKLVKFKGACYGHVIKHAEKKSVIHLDTATQRLHGFQIRRNKDKKVIFSQRLNSNIYPAIDRLLSQVYSHRDFRINLDFDERSHALKIQKIHDTDTFLLFDPNYGEFVFDKAACKTFLVYLIGERYLGVDQSDIFLSDEGEHSLVLDMKKTIQDPDEQDKFAIQYAKDFLAESWKKYTKALEQSDAHVIRALTQIERRFNWSFSAVVKDVQNPRILQEIEELWKVSPLNKFLIPTDRVDPKILVCHDIDLQIKQHNWSPEDTTRLRNFKDYVIKEAPGILTLATVIERWKESQGLIGKNIPYLDLLAEKIEISPYRLGLREAYLKSTAQLKQSVVDGWRECLSSQYWPKGMPRTLAKINGFLRVYQLERYPNLLFKIRDLCQQSHANFIMRILKGRSRALNDFYKNVGNLDLNNPDSYMRMIELIDQFKSQFSPKISSIRNVSIRS